MTLIDMLLYHHATNLYICPYLKPTDGESQISSSCRHQICLHFFRQILLTEGSIDLPF